MGWNRRIDVKIPFYTSRSSDTQHEAQSRSSTHLDTLVRLTVLVFGNVPRFTGVAFSAHSAPMFASVVRHCFWLRMMGCDCFFTIDTWEKKIHVGDQSFFRSCVIESAPNSYEALKTCPAKNWRLPRISFRLTCFRFTNFFSQSRQPSFWKTAQVFREGGSFNPQKSVKFRR
jgi:hypothetical protein